MLQSYLYKTGVEAGCDEAGRGCLAGPVFAASVILPKDFYHPDLNDSKKLSQKKRELLRPLIEREAISWAVSRVDPLEIDNSNILKASFKAMDLSIRQLTRKPTRLLIDGNRYDCETDIPFYCIVKGDGKYSSIAAASILAKTHRDEYMDQLHSLYPQYRWNTNKGYPTREHKLCILKYGSCSHHRQTFNWNIQIALF